MEAGRRAEKQIPRGKTSDPRRVPKPEVGQSSGLDLSVFAVHVQSFTESRRGYRSWVPSSLTAFPSLPPLEEAVTEGMGLELGS